MLSPKFIAFCLSVALPGTLLPAAQADSRPKPANSFHSELWTMEFRTEKKDGSADSQGRDSRGGGARIARAPGAAADMFADERMGYLKVPGQAELNDLQSETPFAEWIVDKAAEPASPQFQHQQRIASAWTLSHSHSEHSKPGVAAQEILANGPSPLTMLVALVASVVMIGAFFSGRE